MYEQDYILRLAKQLAGLLARILGLRGKGAVDEALAEVDRAYGDLFGLPSGLIDVMAPAELARLLGDAQKVAMVAELFETEATLLDERGRLEEAARKRAAAAGLAPYLPAQRK